LTNGAGDFESDTITSGCDGDATHVDLVRVFGLKKGHTMQKAMLFVLSCNSRGVTHQLFKCGSKGRSVFGRIFSTPPGGNSTFLLHASEQKFRDIFSEEKVRKNFCVSGGSERRRKTLGYYC
jgi:hypothetical protein